MDANLVSATASTVPAPYGAGASIAVDDDPRREIRFGAIVAVLFFVIFLGWAAFARLDAAANAQGRLVVTGQRQTVQHRDGGVVGEIMVREGQRVEKGQVLLRLAAAEVRAQERALSSQVIGLLAQRARLRAEQLGLGSVPTPPEFSSLSGENLREARTAMRLQQAELGARRSLLSAQSGVLGQQSAKALQEAEGYRSQSASASEQLKLINDELEGLKGLAEKGFVPMTRVRALERAKAELEGRRGQYTATIAQTGESVGESRLRIIEARRSHQEKVAAETREVELTLNELLPKLSAARDQLSRTEIRAPATGTVVGLSVFTPGGVIAPGQKLMDIVPDKAPLLVEARILPTDADDLTAGHEALIRFQGLHERHLPNLKGEITRVSADSFTDEKTGESYFTAEIVVPFEQMQLVEQVRGGDFALRAGMPVQIMIPLRKRTALQYALEPLTQSLWRSFGEQ